MFSLHVGIGDGTVPSGRLLEYTDDATRKELATNFSALQELPVLSMPEVGDDRFEQVAQIGTATALKPNGNGHRFRFVRDPRFLPIPLTTISALAGDLGITDWELTRTHWAVKNVNLFEVLLAAGADIASGASSVSEPSAVVQFPIDTPRDPRLVAVMMPFSPEFDVIYETIEASVEDAGLTCARADDIWENHHVMDDVLSLLWRARIVIADLTGKNANVFYETGLAHVLPRPTVLLTQHPDDVPFDLRSIRYLRYGLGTGERAKLRKELTARLETLSR